jgi:hypothetical protein
VEPKVINEAWEAGREAFRRGVKCAPMLDGAVLCLIVGKTFKERVAIYNAWSAGWNFENLYGSQEWAQGERLPDAEQTSEYEDYHGK